MKENEFIDTTQFTGGKKEKVHAWSEWALKHKKEMRVIKEAGLLGRENQDWRNIVEHLMVVNSVAVLIAKKIKEAGYAIDIETVDRASILHDVAKRKQREAGISYSTEHNYTITQEILKKAGYSQEVIDAAEYTGRVKDIFKNADDQDESIRTKALEQLLVAYSDARVRNVDIVPLEIARDKNKEKVPKDAAFYDDWYSFYKKVEQLIFNLTGEKLKPEDVINETVFEMVSSL